MRKTIKLRINDNDSIRLYKEHLEDLPLMAFLRSDYVKSCIRLLDRVLHEKFRKSSYYIPNNSI